MSLLRTYYKDSQTTYKHRSFYHINLSQTIVNLKKKILEENCKEQIVIHVDRQQKDLLESAGKYHSFLFGKYRHCEIYWVRRQQNISKEEAERKNTLFILQLGMAIFVMTGQNQVRGWTALVSPTFLLKNTSLI